MLKTIENLIREQDLIPPGSTVLCAVSGGADSIAMLHILYRLRDKLHKPLVPVGLLPPQPVVVVGGGQGKAQLAPQPVQSVEHGDGVRPAGHGAQHPGAGGNQVLLPDKIFNSL